MHVHIIGQELGSVNQKMNALTNIKWLHKSSDISMCITYLGNGAFYDLTWLEINYEITMELHVELIK